MPNHNHNNNATNSSGYTITIGNCPICLNTFAQAIPHYQHICVDRNTHAKRAAHAATPQHRPVQRFFVQKLKRGKNQMKSQSTVKFMEMIPLRPYETRNLLFSGMIETP